MKQPSRSRVPTTRGALAIAALIATACASNPAPGPGPKVAAAEASPDWAELAARRLPLLEPCAWPGLEEKLLCGSLEVWEDRQAAGGRRIPLKVVVVPAQSESPPPDAVFVFEGGPGGAVTGRAVGSAYSGPVRRRDIVLVDQRGTRGSNFLQCDLGGGEGAEPGELRQMFPKGDVAECAARLSRQADLRLYTTEHHADDIEEVRRRLGYGPINLRGGSYGTWAMMTFAQRYPESTRTMFAIGVDSPIRSNLSERGPMTELALAKLSDLCAADPDCRASSPSLADQLAALLTELEAGPRRVELADPFDPDALLALDVTRDWLAEMLRLNLYYAFTSRALPWAAHRAESAGDWEPLVQLGVFIQAMFRSTVSYGVLLSVQCSEHMDFDVEAALARGERTLFGNYRLEQQLQGCSEWPHRRLPPLGVEAPRVLPVPAVFVSGALDPVTPPD